MLMVKDIEAPRSKLQRMRSLSIFNAQRAPFRWLGWGEACGFQNHREGGFKKDIDKNSLWALCNILKKALCVKKKEPQTAIQTVDSRL